MDRACLGEAIVVGYCRRQNTWPSIRMANRLLMKQSRCRGLVKERTPPARRTTCDKTANFIILPIPRELQESTLCVKTMRAPCRYA